MRIQLGDAALFAPPTDTEAIAQQVEAIGAERDRFVAAGRALAAAQTPASYVGRVLEELDSFEPIRRTWGH
jgi:hypothetical protein